MGKMGQRRLWGVLIVVMALLCVWVTHALAEGGETYRVIIGDVEHGTVTADV